MTHAEGAGEMKGSGNGSLFLTHPVRGMWLALLVSPAFAQISPLTTQSLFFDQASNAHRGNYLEVDTRGSYTTTTSTLHPTDPVTRWP